MRERLLTLLFAGLALLALGSLLGGGRSAGEQASRISRPGSQDAGAAGLLGAWRWMESSGLRVLRLRERYSALDAQGLGLTPTGNLLVVHVPMVHTPRRAERAALSGWVARGNHLLLMQSPSQRTAWGGLPGRHLIETAVGIERDEPDWVSVPGGEPQYMQQEFPACQSPEVTHGTISGPLRRLRPYPPHAAHPLLSGVSEVQLRTPAIGNLSLVSAGPGRMSYPLLCDPLTQLPVFTLTRHGDGRVWSSDYSELFVNDNLGRGDNARLLANLVGLALGSGGAVIFDDMHQGDSVLYDPAAFFSDPRLQATLGFLLAIWALWLLADSGRFSSLPASPSPQSGIEFVRMQGQFLGRHLRRGESAHELLRGFHDAVRLRLAQPRNGEPSWSLLSAHAAVTAAPLAELRRLAARVQARRRVDLVTLHNLTLLIRRELE